MDHFSKVFIEFVTILLLFYVLVFRPRGMWDLSSLTRDRTRTPCIGRQSLNHWTTREVPPPQNFKNQMELLKRFNSWTFHIKIQISGFSWKTWIYMPKNWTAATCCGSSLLTKSMWSRPIPLPHPLKPLTHIYVSDSWYLWPTLLTCWAAIAVVFIRQHLYWPRMFSGVMGFVYLWTFSHSKSQWDPPWCLC